MFWLTKDDVIKAFQSYALISSLCLKNKIKRFTITLPQTFQILILSGKF